MMKVSRCQKQLQFHVQKSLQSYINVFNFCGCIVGRFGLAIGATTRYRITGQFYLVTGSDLSVSCPDTLTKLSILD